MTSLDVGGKAVDILGDDLLDFVEFHLVLVGNFGDFKIDDFG